ncbi:MAG: hypothetical protein JNJ75_04570 [Cyclobacteriaceae bacterium]|nr:hypothetical protein [Cyclobacteriaceae bacterium]
MKWTSYHTKEITQKYLFKFLSLKYTIDFMSSGDIWFSRASEFGDKMECVLISDLTSATLNRDLIEARKKKTLISCWHLADKESVAMWDVYSKSESERKVCAIRFERKDIDKLIKKSWPTDLNVGTVRALTYGKVQYRNLINSQNIEKELVKFNAFRKESSFRYECEYRYVVQLINQFAADGLRVSIGNPTRLPFTVLLNPLLDKIQYENLRSELKGYSNVEHSSLAKWLKPEMW